MRSLVIYYDKSDDVVLNYVREFSSEVYIYSPEPKIVPQDSNTVSGNLIDVLDSMKDRIDVVAFRERNSYSIDFLKTGNLVNEIKKRGLKFLIIH